MEGSGDERETGKGGGKEGFGVNGRVGEKSSEGRKGLRKEGLGGTGRRRTGRRKDWKKDVLEERKIEEGRN